MADALPIPTLTPLVMSSFGIYIVGFIILIIGVAFGMSTLGVSTTWIVIASLILIGLGVMMGVSKTRRPDPPA